MLGAVDPEPLIEVLFFEGCPHYQPLVSRLRQLLQTSNIDIEIVEREMITDEMSVEQRFRGSPTVRINGVDVDPTLSDREEYGLSCHLYQTPDGLVALLQTSGLCRRYKGPRQTEPESPHRNLITVGSPTVRINGVDVDLILSDREELRGILGARPFPATRQHQCIDY
jgi:hypothetical protein